MRAIPTLDHRWPVRTVYTGWEDTLHLPRWTDPAARDAHLQAFFPTPITPVFAVETHSSHVWAVTDAAGSLVPAVTGEPGIKPGGYDALVTDVPGVLLCIWTADCLPLTLYDPVHHAAAMVHCGWRGICGGIAAGALTAMELRYGTRPGDVEAVMGPCICADCYEVGGELRERFALGYTAAEVDTLFRPGRAGKYLLDLRRAVCLQLEHSGAAAEHIHDLGICTFEDSRYPSYRRERRTEKGKQILSGIVLLRR